jgi:hypothetical protein
VPRLCAQLGVLPVAALVCSGRAALAAALRRALLLDAAVALGSCSGCSFGVAGRWGGALGVLPGPVALHVQRETVSGCCASVVWKVGSVQRMDGGQHLAC